MRKNKKRGKYRRMRRDMVKIGVGSKGRRDERKTNQVVKGSMERRSSEK